MLSMILLSLSFTLIQVPFDKFCNKPGSSRAPRLIRSELLKKTSFNIDSDELVKFDDPIDTFYSLFDFCKTAQAKSSVPVTLGGDHSLAIPSVFSSQNTCLEKNMTLGVMWIDAHADFNTMECSESKNIHGMPVAVLCQHTMSELAMGEKLEPSQFRFIGVRDVDPMEQLRMKEYDMKICDLNELVIWLESIDKVHVSWDIDSIDPGEISSVNTPVANGLSCDTVRQLFDKIRQSNKLIALDVVEYNPCGDIQFTDLSSIIDILKSII